MIGERVVKVSLEELTFDLVKRSDKFTETNMSPYRDWLQKVEMKGSVNTKNWTIMVVTPHTSFTKN